MISDRYWNGSGSLQTNRKFQTIAIEMICRYLEEKEVFTDNCSDGMASRDGEITKLRDLLQQMHTENEKIKKRLQNEEEIQRTIELTDQDLVSYFQRKIDSKFFS